MPGGRNGVLLTLSEAEGQRGWQMGFLPLPLGQVCAPSLTGEQQPRAGREEILSGKEGQFPPFWSEKG